MNSGSKMVEPALRIIGCRDRPMVSLITFKAQRKAQQLPPLQPIAAVIDTLEDVSPTNSVMFVKKIAKSARLKNNTTLIARNHGVRDLLISQFADHLLLAGNNHEAPRILSLRKLRRFVATESQSRLPGFNYCSMSSVLRTSASRQHYP